MTRWVRARPVIVAGVLVAIAIMTTTASVPATAGAATVARASEAGASGLHLQIAPVGSTAGAGGGGIAVTVDPGASVQRSFVVTNRSAGLRVTVQLAGVDATTRPGGNVEYAASASADGAGSWLTMSDIVTTLEPGANARVTLTIEPPANVAPGNVSAGVVARVENAARVSDNRAVAGTTAVSMPVAINVKGAATALVSIASVRAVKSGGRTSLEITFQNGGATPATMSGTVKVAGAHSQTTPVHAAIAPLTHTIVRVPIAMPSDAPVPVSVATSDARGDDASWSGNVGEDAAEVPASIPAKQTSHTASHAASGSAGIPRAALVVVALVFGAAAIWFALELRRNRARRRAHVVAPRLPSATAQPVATAPGAAVPAELEHMGAVGAQLAALVEAIDRLVGRLGEVAIPMAPAPTPAPRPAAPTPAPPRPDEPITRDPALDPGPMFYAPAASGVPGDEVDPFDWPSQAQLDRFAERRRAAPPDR